MRLRSIILPILLALGLPVLTATANDWNESLDGDLSGDGSNPTFITFTNGYNLIEGTMGRLGGTGPVDADIWRFTIDPGFLLTEIIMYSYSAPSSGINSFMAIDDATTINTSDPSQHLSNGLFTEEFDGLGNTHTDMMDILRAGPAFGGTGFSGDLGAGDYTFWVQETTDQIQYCIAFEVTPVPEPGSVLLLGGAALLLLRRRRARDR